MARSARAEAMRQLEVAMVTLRAADRAAARALEDARRRAARAVVAGWPKGEVARVVGVHPATLSRWPGMPAHHNVAQTVSDKRLRSE